MIAATRRWSRGSSAAARAVERAAALCRASLGEAAFALRLREGARLGDADVAALAFATDDAA